MKEHELSEQAIAEGQKQARSVFEKRADNELVRRVHLREDELAALLARAFSAGEKTRS